MTRFSDSKACLWRAEAERFDRMLEPYGSRLIDAAGLASGDRMLDIGCGAGATTLHAAAIVTPGGTATGIDCNPSMIELAAQRADNQDNVAFICADAASHRYAPSFDAVISRFGMMLFPEPEQAFTHICASARPGGSVTYTTWTRPRANAWHTLSYRALGVPVIEEPRGPFALSDPDTNARLLKLAGCIDIEIQTLETDVWVGTDVADALEFFRGSLNGYVPNGTDLNAAVDRARPLLADHATPSGIYLPSVALLCHATRSARK
ncbi:class I SAM-dependent methyltransferase [Streptomyces sp. NPDC002659]|uniref:class I SAM-dependent methyltransferase n=1 Tax=Streptomyces sp. NPDC002659 TaxID=3364656 RepID=UPI0036926C2C